MQYSNPLNESSPQNHINPLSNKTIINSFSILGINLTDSTVNTSPANVLKILDNVETKTRQNISTRKINESELYYIYPLDEEFWWRWPTPERYII